MRARRTASNWARNGLQAFLDAFPDVKVTVDDVLVVNDLVIARLSYVGTYKNSFFGMRLTGKKVITHSLDVWRLENGPAVEHWGNVGPGFLQGS